MTQINKKVFLVDCEKKLMLCVLKYKLIIYAFKFSFKNKLVIDVVTGRKRNFINSILFLKYKVKKNTIRDKISLL